MSTQKSSDQPWWKEAIVYQIYPASYKDSTGDGLGDLPGIISKLDYIKELGVTAIWVCPMYESPQVDMGYDISNYQAVYPPYGTMADMDTLIRECHARGLHLILDLVVNHTSNKHAWFKASSSSKDNPKRNWYVWRPPRYDAAGNRKPPNNWRGNFGGSVWEWDETTQEYYLHLFCPEQPDLNWESEETRKAIFESAMIFWLEKGVDGFRIDTVNMYSKDPAFEDAEVVDPQSEWQLAFHLFCNGPKMDEYLHEMNEILDRYRAVSIGECPCTPDLSRVLRYVSAKEKQLNMVFDFAPVDVGMGSVKFNTTPRNWKLPQLKAAITKSQILIDGTDAWTTVFLENHDQARSISRFGSDETPEYRNLSGKMLSMLLITLSGTLFIYQGQEIGMVNVPRSWTMDSYEDVDSNNYYNDVAKKSGNDPRELEKAMDAIHYLARDNARTPMQWDNTQNGGFTTSQSTWQRVNDSYHNINVKQEQSDPESILKFWQSMIQMRKKYAELLVHGRYEIIEPEDLNLFLYKKSIGNTAVLVALNFSKEEQVFDAAKWSQNETELLVSNYKGTDQKLRPFEGRVYLLK